MDLRPGPESPRAYEVKPDEVDPIRRALHVSREWYQDLIEHSQDLLCIHDLEGRLLSVNPASARLLGYSVREMLSMPMREHIAPEYRDEFDAYLERIKHEGQAHGNLVVITRSGERRVWEYSNSLRRVSAGPAIVSGLARDITEQKRMECQLREANQNLVSKVHELEGVIRDMKLFRTLVDQSSDAIEVVDPITLRFLDANDKACSELGYSREEFLSLSVFDIDPAVTEASTAAIMEQLRESGFVTMESVHRRRDGTTFPVELRMTRVHIDRDYVINTARDLTERQQAETRLRASERRYRAVHDCAPVGICIVESGSGRFLKVNPRYCEITGRTEQDLLTRDFKSVVHPDDVASNCEKLMTLVKGKVSRCAMEKRYRRPDGSVRWVESEIVAMGDMGEIPNCYMAIVHDITERRLSEERLREHERVVEGVEDMIVVLDREYRFVIANRAYLSYRNVEREQVTGRPVAEIVGKEAFENTMKGKMDECFRGNVIRYEMRFTYPTLGERDLFLSYFPIEGPSGVDQIAVILRDVTERKQAQDALTRSEENYRNFVAQSSEGIFQEEMSTPASINLPEDELVHRILYDGYIAECNDSMAAMYGLSSSKELRERPWREMVLPADPQNIEMTRQFIRSGFRLLEHESHEIDIHGNPKVFLNSMIGTVEDGRLVRTWGIQRDITEKTKSEDARTKAEEELRLNVTQLQQVTQELHLAKEKLAEEKLYLEETIDAELGFGEIIGRSEALKSVLEKVTKVAPSDATVLLLGETGTGKELVARALHRRSKRNDQSFIKLNCAAIPSGLLESELFGHEKGAFTGAVARKLGRLELADNGTLFLDEIGEIPVNLQPKLLRVLQDQEFERLGGTQTLKVNFRLLAATNRDLLQSVKAREFRSDLFYRLNVFPIIMPPLRERREDIRPLVEHFVRKFSAQMKKSVTSIPSNTMQTLVRWEWPGNIRELENFVERSVILTPGSVLQTPLAELHADPEDGEGGDKRFLRDMQRTRILRVLRECHGKLGGADGAAARLGLKRTTLQSKLDLLGIKPASYRT